MKVEQSIWPSIEGDGSVRLKPAASAVISSPDGTGDMEGNKATEAKRPRPYASQRDWDAVGSEISKELEVYTYIYTYFYNKYMIHIYVYVRIYM
jgi:preprotein translocase subunit SecF